MAPTDLQAFTNDALGTIRTVEHEGKVYFCGRDVATALEYKDPVSAINQHGRGAAFRHLITDALDTSDLDVEPAGLLAQINEVSKKFQSMMTP